MPRKCCVPECKTNYDSTLKREKAKSTFSFPKNEYLRKKWLKAIPRKDWQPTKYSVVCSVHFEQGDIIKFVKTVSPEGTLNDTPCVPTLKEKAVPSIFPNLPQYSSTTKSVHRKNPKCRRPNKIHQHELLVRSGSKPSTSTTKCSSKVDKTSENRKAKPNAQKEPQTLLIYPESANLPDCSHPSSNNTKCSLELEPQDYVSQVEVKIEPDTVIIKNEPLHEYPEVDYNTTTVPLEFLPESTVEVSEMAITFPRSPSSGTAFCRLCLKPTNNAGMVSLTALNANSHINSKEFDTSEVDADKFAKMIKTLMPSFNFGLVYNPMMCDFCSSRLELAFKFVEEVMSSQRTIEAFKEQYGRNEEMVLCEDVIKYQSKLSDPCPPKKKRKLSKLTRKYLQSSETESASSNDGDVGDYLTSTDEPIDIVKKESFYSLEEEVKIEIDSFDVECDSFTQMETDSCASGDDYYRTVKSEPEEADDIYRDSNYQYSRFNLANNQDTDVLDDGSLVTRAKDRCLSSTPAGTIRYVKKS